jgi:hypothetical protein
MLRRTGFKRPERPPQVPALLRPLERAPNYACISANDPAPAVEKENPLRSEIYRRLVAAMPCAYCLRPGRSQHAHENDGKGKAQKLDDRRGMPLCADEPGREGCHTKFDQYRLLSGGRRAHVAYGQLWAAQTRAAILAAGTWPKNLPLWSES